MKKISVYIADDHLLFRKALTCLLADFPRVGHIRDVASGKELLDLVRQDTPDVAVVDLMMPGLDGFKVCERLSYDYPELKILVVSMYDSYGHIYSAIESGAHAYLSKSSDTEELEEAITSIVDKGIYRNAKMIRALRHGIGKPLLLKPAGQLLTERELNIIEKLVQGHTTEEISRMLSLSKNTVRNHKVRIMKKLGVRNNAALIRYAIDNKLVSDE